MLNVENMLVGEWRRVSHVTRYQSHPVARRENVAEHHFYVAAMACLIGHDLISKGVPVDMGVLLSRCLVHDLDEAVTGDVVRSIKHGHEGLRNALHEVGSQGVQRLSAELGAPYVHGLWESGKDASVEGNILKLTDLLSVVSYAIEETRCGNRSMQGIIEEIYNHLDGLLTSGKLSSEMTPYLETARGVLRKAMRGDLL